MANTRISDSIRAQRRKERNEALTARILVALSALAFWGIVGLHVWEAIHG